MDPKLDHSEQCFFLFFNCGKSELREDMIDLYQVTEILLQVKNGESCACLISDQGAVFGPAAMATAVAAEVATEELVAAGGDGAAPPFPALGMAGVAGVSGSASFLPFFPFLPFVPFFPFFPFFSFLYKTVLFLYRK